LSGIIGKQGFVTGGCRVNDSYLLSSGDNAHLFHEEGVFNYSTMLLREDLDLLLLGAREAVYALDLKDISKKLASVRAPTLTVQLRPILMAILKPLCCEAQQTNGFSLGFKTFYTAT